MRKVLYILGQLDDLDVEWMARHGIKRHVDDGQDLIRQGKPTSAIYFILEGTMTVTIQGLGQVAVLGSGELLGEMAFIEQATASATVTGERGAVVLELLRGDLDAKIAADDGFARRIFQAMALFLASRLRNTEQRMARQSGAVIDEDDDELDGTLLDGISLAGERFDRLLRILASARTV